MVKMMAKGGKGPVRVSQLIVPFGVGAISVLRNGLSVITAGLDNWYMHPDRNNLKEDEFKINEHRLKGLLKVNHFRRPPDYRPSYKNKGSYSKNLDLLIPHMRFPTWFYCQKCRLLKKKSLYTSENYLKCECGGNLLAVPIIAVCEDGHMQDFPWFQWSHKSATAYCAGALSLINKGGTTLQGLQISCTCGISRTLANVLNANKDSSFLTSNLEPKGQPFLCEGKMPWIDSVENCEKQLKGTLKSSSNNYYPRVVSSILIPLEDLSSKQKILNIISDNRIFSNIVNALITIVNNSNLEQVLGQCIDQIKTEDLHNDLENFSHDLILDVLRSQFLGQEICNEDDHVLSDSPYQNFTREEINIIIKEKHSDELDVTKIDHDRILSKYFSGIYRVNKLTEVKVLTGFSRIFPQDSELYNVSHLLRKDNPTPYSKDNWLPATKIQGEGIFINFNENSLSLWEKEDSIVSRIAMLNDRANATNLFNQVKIPIIPRTILIHTFTHIIIKELVYECGYSASALNERLYISDDNEKPMGGVLIYTGQTGSDGTLGGLSRMSEKQKITDTINRAIEKSIWCASDPICMEIGTEQGQGYYNMNNAACHHCTLIPTTSCNHFNLLLDRATIKGNAKYGIKGYFTGI